MKIKFATEEDVPLILTFIKELADYEKLLHEVVATEDLLKENLFGKKKSAEVIFAYEEEEPVGFALFFQNFSTFLGKPGIYLEDLYVKPTHRGKGIGQQLLAFLAHLAKERNCGRLDWWVLNWNKKAIAVYEKTGASPMTEWTTYRLSGQKIDQLATVFNRASLTN
jgi:GNAT superfamily N-acetyltransferase